MTDRGNRLVLRVYRNSLLLLHHEMLLVCARQVKGRLSTLVTPHFCLRVEAAVVLLDRLGPGLPRVPKRQHDLLGAPIEILKRVLVHGKASRRRVLLVRSE